LGTTVKVRLTARFSSEAVKVGQTARFPGALTWRRSEA
jgi:hypothetical protein